MVPLVQNLVIENNWMGMEEVVDFIAISELTPGPLAINMATYVGNKTAGLLGAFVCTFGVALPSFIVILLISNAYKKIQENVWIRSAINGIKPVVVGLILAAVFSIVCKVFTYGESIESIFDKSNIILVVIIIIDGVLVKYKKHPIYIICISAILGIVLNMCI